MDLLLRFDLGAVPVAVPPLFLASRRSPAPVAVASAPVAPTPMVAQTTGLPAGWIQAFQEAQRQTAQAHTVFQQTMASAHASYLDAAVRTARFYATSVQQPDGTIVPKDFSGSSFEDLELFNNRLILASNFVASSDLNRDLFGRFTLAPVFDRDLLREWYEYNLTGFTDQAGYGFLGTAERNGRRLVMVVAGADRGSERNRASRAFMEWGFKAFDSRILARKNQPIASARVQNGSLGEVPLVADQDVRGIIANLRSVQWDSMKVNFFVEASKALLTELPATFIASFRLDRESYPIMRELVQESPSVTIIDGLTRSGATVCAFDPVANRTAEQLFGKQNRCTIAEDAYAVLDDADALLVITEWKSFRSPDFDAIRSRMRGNIIFDGRNIYDPQSVRDHGLKWQGIGRPSKEGLTTDTGKE